MMQQKYGELFLVQCPHRKNCINGREHPDGRINRRRGHCNNFGRYYNHYLIQWYSFFSSLLIQGGEESTTTTAFNFDNTEHPKCTESAIINKTGAEESTTTTTVFNFDDMDQPKINVGSKTNSVPRFASAAIGARGPRPWRGFTHGPQTTAKRPKGRVRPDQDMMAMDWGGGT